jgi:hypothetical protein
MAPNALDRPVRLTLVALLAILVSAAGAPQPASASFPGDEGRITVNCGMDGIWSMNADGSDRRQLAVGEFGQYAWSPGGTQIAFSRYHEGKARLWLMNPDGSNQRVVRSSATLLWMSLAWSPDGRYLAFDEQMDEAERFRIAVLDLDTGTVDTVISSAFDAGWRPETPEWSPDGDEIAFVHVVDGNRSGLRAIEPDGDNLRVLTSPPWDDLDRNPEWDPAGERFLFARHTRPEWGISIYAGDAAGGEEVRLTDESVEILDSAYSPAGDRIAYTAAPLRSGPDPDPYSVWMMNEDGSGKHVIAEEMNCGGLDWQPMPDFPLVDARFSSYESAIRWAFAEGITTGCTAERFCDRRTVIRGQLATFLAEALNLPAATDDHFTDDDGTTHEDDINRLADAGLASGCGAGRFCPSEPVTRAQSASFLARALDLPATDADYFEDDDGMTHEADINRLAEAGLASGCVAGWFCPTRTITRGEAVTFLYRALAE